MPTEEKTQEIAGKVKEIMAQQLGRTIEDLTADASFDKDLGADSLMLLEMMRELEEEFNIEIPDEDQEQVMTVGQAIDYVVAKVGDSEGGEGQ